MKYITKAVFAFILIFTMAASLCACGSKTPESGTLVLPETPMADPAESVTLTESEHAEMLTAYQSALQNFALNHILPDGTEFELGEGFGYMEENAFAIYDVDSDGVEELLIRFTTAPTAGMFEGVYHYENGAITEQLTAYPGCTYYLNNTVQCPWSHNQTNGPADFWPYSVCVYKNAADTYEYAAQVVAWDKTVSETDSNGNAFPADKDDGSGVVYSVTTAGSETPEVYSQTEFGIWEQLTFGGEIVHQNPSTEETEQTGSGALAHNIPWQDMIETNISCIAG